MGGAARSRLSRLILLGAIALALPAAATEAGRPLRFDDLPGWAQDDHRAALAAFRRTCSVPPLCAAARDAGDDHAAVRRFFEERFEPVEIAGDGFLTGYFEPEFDGTLQPDAAHPTPLRSAPAGLVTRPDPSPMDWPAGVTTARRTATGHAALPDRAAIEDGALDGETTPLVYLDPVDAFTVHIQGSARIRLPDGRVVRVGFAGKNGHPYTAIGRVLAVREGIPPSELTADRLWTRLRERPDEARSLMRENRSYIFFALRPEQPVPERNSQPRHPEEAAKQLSRRTHNAGACFETRPAGVPQHDAVGCLNATSSEVAVTSGDGPIGAAGTPLVAGRSLAVDAAAWPYGTLVWLEGELPKPEGGTAPLRRLVVAQDTGTAIVGRARGDLFTGSGARAGSEAALIRHPVRWVILRPRGGRSGPPGR